MLRLGITGGIGSGKSIVARVFSTLGIPVYHADTAAKTLISADPALRTAIIGLLGEAAYQNNLPNKAFIATKIFGDQALLAAYNAIVHPAVIAFGENWFDQQEKAGHPYAIKEAALFFETGSTSGLDKIIGVFAPDSLRLHRAMKRDGVTKEEVIRRMSNQLDESLKMKLCDYVITNDDQHLVTPQVLRLHMQFLNKSPQVYSEN
ncbi:dephospho-CoA kinase [Flavihumibacter petaseus]|uniref:Dephospho-CoA kinase n=1 Tax=Flavihumibacter petaseus NBRC 106054 TaxID=1220578 RepID=A0A0E9N3P7_9BACT|nr:dephospho-CoA kinase [Flavihumibacter petaseus]GAO44311.1 dephospho-CoA kinase [Flavihumibacter petaseus NBRC 106054]